MGFENYMFVQIFFLLGVLLFLGREVFLASKRSDKGDQKLLYLLQPILLIGVIVRLVNLSYPVGLNLDEAMGGYDAWCLAHYGVDSNLQSYPVYLISWGSGMNALYIYLAIPFVKLFGLSEAVYRLPMALIGSSTLIFFYWILRKTQKEISLVLVLASFLAICPWHIMKSRIGLESFLASDIVFLGLFFIILGYYLTNKNKQFIAYAIGFVFIAMCAYAYAATWVVLPFLCILIFVFLYRFKKITINKIVFIGTLVLLIVLPLIYFCCILFFDLDSLTIGNITIPKLLANRADATISFAEGQPVFQRVSKGFVNILKLFILGTDGVTVEASFPLYGFFYNIVSLPFLAYGIWYTYKTRNVVMIFLSFLLLSSVFLVLFVSAGTTHWNIIWTPLACFVAYGIYFFVVSYKQCKILFSSMYLILFVLFITNYFNSNVFNPFYYHTIKEPIMYVKSQDFKKVYYPNGTVHSLVLFYDPIDPYTFANSLVRDGNPIAHAKKYGNVVFGYSGNIEPEIGTAYVISNNWLYLIDPSQFKIKQGLHYSVIWSD